MAASDSGQPGLPYIGSRISLISKSEIRYEGTLFTIDMNESTIALSNVRSFGTEGRRQNGAQVMPSPDLYEYIIFKGTDILDLTVLTDGPQQPPPDPIQQDLSVPNGAPQYGAPPSAFTPAPPAPPAAAAPYGSAGPWAPSAAPPQNNYNQYVPHNPWGPPSSGMPPPAPSAQPYGDPAKPPGFGGPQTAPQPQPIMPAQVPASTAAPLPTSLAPTVPPTVTLTPSAPQRSAVNQAPSTNALEAATQAATAAVSKPNSYANAAGAGRGGAAGRGDRPGRGAPAQRGGRGPAPAPVRSAAPQAGRGAATATAQKPSLNIPNEEFNFEEQNKRFNKEEVLKEAAEKVTKPVYNKDDFFDTMSCEALERLRIQEEGQRAEYRQRIQEQRKLDIETFGGLGNFRHGGRGRGRGSHYGGRGRNGTHYHGHGQGRGGHSHSHSSGGRGPARDKANA